MGISIKLDITNRSLLIGGGFLLMYYLLSSDNDEKCLSKEEEEVAKALIPSNFDSIHLPKEIAACSRELFLNGHFAQAVFEACKALELYIQKKLGLQTGLHHTTPSGQRLMSKVWGENGDMSKALVCVKSLNTEEQKKIYELSIWIIKYVRNVNAHKIVKKDEKSALAHLHEINVIASTFDESVYRQTGEMLRDSINDTVGVKL